MDNAPLNRVDSFCLAEFEALRGEILQSVKELAELLRYGLVSTGGIWAWLLTAPKGQVPPFATFLPFVVSVGLFIETLLVRRSVLHVAVYIRTLEKNFALPLGIGWETSRVAARERFGPHKTDPISVLENFIWIAMVAGNLVAASLYVFRP